MKTLLPYAGRGRRVEYHGRKTYLPNARHQGSGLIHAKPGHFIKFEIDGKEYFGRVIGTIDSHDTCEGREVGSEHKGNLLVSMLGSTVCFAMEMWVAPEDVTSCEEPERAAKFLAEFFAMTPEELAAYNRRT